MSIPAPVVGECYRWDVSADVVSLNGGTGEATGYAKENILSPSLMFTGRTTDKDDDSGWRVLLAASQTVYGAEITNCELSSGELAGVAMYSDAAFSTVTFNPGRRPAVASGVWTSHSQAKDFLPTRSSFIGGVDNLPAGPTPADPPVPASVACRSVIVSFLTGATARTYWELGFLGLMINARALEAIDEHALGIDMIQLRSGGTGFRWTVKWPRLPMVQANYMRALWASSDNGNWPIFFFPNPGQKASATGIITGERYTQGGRGGLARMISWHDDEQHGVGGSQYASNCEIVAESWQEERSQ